LIPYLSTTLPSPRTRHARKQTVVAVVAVADHGAVEDVEVPPAVVVVVVDSRFSVFF
jgi:hypothetical protein